MTKARITRWSRITGLDLGALSVLGVDASRGYNNGYGTLSSGFDAGAELSHALPGGSRSTDRRLRAWGDFLIDLGDSLGG